MTARNTCASCFAPSEALTFSEQPMAFTFITSRATMMMRANMGGTLPRHRTPVATHASRGAWSLGGSNDNPIDAWEHIRRHSCVPSGTN